MDEHPESPQVDPKLPPADNRVDVLDHGLVRLVDHMGGDLAISRSARVSYDAPPRAEDTRLIQYLWENGHTTPFESTSLTFEIKAPIFVIRQWHRHRTQSYNELSARYRELPEEFYVPELEQITTQSTDNKQMRTAEQHPEALAIRTTLLESQAASFREYHRMLAAGAPRELSRSVLPVGTYTHMFATMNLLNLFKFLGERLHPHAQYEIRVYAEAMLELVRPIAPIAVTAFENTKLS